MSLMFPPSAPRLPSALQTPPTQHAPPAAPIWWRQAALRAAALCLAAAAAGGVAPPPAAASIPLSQGVSVGGGGPPTAEAQRAWAISQLGGRYAPAPGGQQQQQPENPERVRIRQLQALMQAGNAAVAEGRYAAALASFDTVVQQYPDFATTEYARLSRALMLYQLGRTSDALLQLEDLEVSLRGYAEVHAALASMLYVERPALLEYAEQQWAIAMDFSRNFADPEWVATNKRWPPKMLAALDRFLRLA